MDTELITLAREASAKAYAPYSKFRVGAALRTSTGKIFCGCNVENASYGLTCCAERNAIGQMVVGGETKFTAIAIFTPTDRPTAPCGACRQVLFEFNPNGIVISACEGPTVLENTVNELLPGAFGPSNLEG